MLNSVPVLYCTLCSVRCLNINVVNLLSFIEHVENTLSKVNSKFMTPAFHFTYRPTGLLRDYLCFRA